MDNQDEIKRKAYFIGLYKDRNRIKHTPEEDWLEAEQEMNELKKLTSGYLKERYKWPI